MFTKSVKVDFGSACKFAWISIQLDIPSNHQYNSCLHHEELGASLNFACPAEFRATQ